MQTEILLKMNTLVCTCQRDTKVQTNPLFISVTFNRCNDNQEQLFPPFILTGPSHTSQSYQCKWSQHQHKKGSEAKFKAPMPLSYLLEPIQGRITAIKKIEAWLHHQTSLLSSSYWCSRVLKANHRLFPYIQWQGMKLLQKSWLLLIPKLKITSV